MNYGRWSLNFIKNDATGIFHTAGAESISRYDLALKTAEIGHFDTSLVKPTSTENMNWITKQPKNSSLDVSKISKLKKTI